MPSPKEKLQELLKELFQFGSADLDFGIYRVMNFKRDIIERFIQKDLIEAVDKELSSGMLASQSQAASELKEVAAQICETLGEEALDGDGNLTKEFHNTKVGKHYLELQPRASQAQERPAFEATIFNHLYAFFSRYYDNGDFLSKRRYSRREKYAVPYNGEEVYLHWANNDQYYVKTGEYFNDYQFKSPYGISVHFKLVAADVEKDNVKGDKRFFLPLSYAVTFDEEKKEITIPFQYRPLTEQEEIKYGQRNEQDAITKESLTTIPAKLEKDIATLPALLSVHHTTADGQQVNYLEYHLRRYTRRNTSDFFVHKDLKGFLTRELDFYLKNEVLNLDEMEAGGEARSEAWFQIMHVIRSIGSRVIEFLAQIEDFQKRLFEKRKFILETQYCITMANVPKDFHAEIAECEAQWQEWKELVHLDEEQPNLFTSAAKNKKEHRINALKEHPTLALDTKHFDQQFKDRLLASYDNLYELTDALLIYSENFQALNLLRQSYRERIKCIYIDPPYNTGNDRFIYKDRYQHSSWLAMMEARLRLAADLMKDDGMLFVSIDGNERDRLKILGDHIFGFEWYLNTFVWINNLKGRQISGQGAAGAHEYVLAFGGKDTGIFTALVEKVKDIMPATYKGFDYETEEDDIGSYVLKNELYNTNSKFNEETRPNLVFNIHYNFTTGEIKFSDIDDETEFEGFEKIIPKQNNDGVHKYHAWRWGKDKIAREKNNLEFVQAKERVKIYTKVRTFQVTTLKDIISDITTNAGEEDLRDLFGASVFMDYPKPVSLVEIFTSQTEQTDLVADFFAGSGTTAHAVINLNREDEGNRKFILVEMGDYFNTVLIPRIKKVTYTPEWKDGKPKRSATTEESERSPRIVKYLRLESYEDALNNITFPDVPKKLYDFDDYLLKYMLAWETKESETLLNVEKLTSPFSYKLTITGGEELQEKQVDIPETYAYLLGLNVKTRRVYRDKERYYLVYRGTVDHREIVVIWRETSGWEKTDYERDKQFVEEQMLIEGTDEVFVNGNSYIPKARALESIFKSRMFGSL